MDHTSHRRFNPLTRSWILCSPHRAARPWLGQEEAAQAPSTITYDPKCYLCPNNLRANGERNPDYVSTNTFTNDFSALQATKPALEAETSSSSLLQSKLTRGLCKVICFSPNHGLTMPLMPLDGIRVVIDEWVRIQTDLEKTEYISHVQIFENKGAVMGCSNPHPHGQVWATEEVPEEPAKEFSAQHDHFRSSGKCLLCEYVTLETSLKTRVVCENASFVCLVPYWALWPFETIVLPKAHHSTLKSLSDTQRSDLAEILKRITTRYDNLFNCSFPYSMGLHGAPARTESLSSSSASSSDDEKDRFCHFHIHFYPPLLRNSSVKKFLVGFEMLAEPQRDLTPEQAASRLQGLSEVHYSLSQ